MANIATIIGLLVIVLGTLWQVRVKNLAYIAFNIGRTEQTIAEFPYTCRKVEHELLQSCEDMWLDEEERKLYGFCGNVIGRQYWCPSNDRLDSSKLYNDHVSVLNIDELGNDGLYGLHKLSISKSFKGEAQGPELHLHGFDVEKLQEGRLRFWMINHRAPVDHTTGKIIDASKIGANSTIEVFELAKGSQQLEFVRTIVDEAVYTPNGIAATGDGGFLSTNDHAVKAGFVRELEVLIGGGTVSFCNSDNKCHTTSRPRFFFPNGITRGKDGLYYVANSGTGDINVLALQPDNSLIEKDRISLNMAIDNISVDSNGDLYVAGFSNTLKLLAVHHAPLTKIAPAAIFKIRKLAGEDRKSEYEVVKVLEDRDSEFLSTTTVAVHDPKTGRLFMGGVHSQWLTVCERNK